MKLDILLVSLNFSLGLAAYETGMSIGSRFQDLDPILAPIRSASYNPSNSRVQFAAPWYLDRIDQRDAILDHTFISDNYAENVNIYIVSAGVNGAHVDFRGVSNDTSRVKAAYTVDPGSPADIDIRGEGTIAAASAAGAIHGVAKSATIHSVKVFRDDVLDYTAPRQDVLDGLAWIMHHHSKPAVVLWLTFASTISAHDAAKEAMLRNLTQAGLPVVVPAGFSPVEGSTATSSDACDIALANSARSFTVSTSARDDSLASGSIVGREFQARSGECVALFAPGIDVIGPRRSPASSELVMVSSPVIAPALAAGVAATFLSAFPTAQPDQVHQALLDSATLDTVHVSNGVMRPLLYNRIIPFGTGKLPAGLYPSNMEFSSSGPRNSKPVINLGLHFHDRIPHILEPEDIHIALEGEKGRLPTNVTKIPGKTHGYIISTILPEDYLGKVTVTTSYTKSLTFQQVLMTVATSTAHELV